MTIYKVPNGWLFKYDFQPHNFFYYIEDKIPTFAEAVNIDIDMQGYEVEYHVLPEDIQIVIASTQSVLIETTVASNKHLADVIESMTKKDEDDES
jgi:hypothetical protein